MMIRYQEMGELARESSRTKKRDGFRIAECVPFSIGLECRQGFPWVQPGWRLTSVVVFQVEQWNCRSGDQVLDDSRELGAGFGQAVEVVLALAARGNNIAVPQ